MDSQIFLHGISRSSDADLLNVTYSGGRKFSIGYAYDFSEELPIGYIVQFFSSGILVPYIMKALPGKVNVGKRITGIPIDELRDNPYALVGSFASHRAVWYVWAGALIRNGLLVGMGVPPYKTHLKNDKERAQILRISEIELEFERVRREVNPEAPSRLDCLWLADESENGGRVISQSLFGRGVYEVFPVRIVKQRAFHRADFRWVEQYEQNQCEDYLVKYWEGIPFSEDWEGEYLLDGIIELENKDNLEGIKEFAVRSLKLGKVDNV